MEPINNIKNSILENIKVKNKLLKDTELLQKINDISLLIFERLTEGNKLLLAGNGGSAADAQHIAAEFIGRFEKERRSLPAIALTTDTSILTAIANDYSYDDIFTRQIEGVGTNNDIFIGLTTSGKSNNILKAIKKAKEKSMTTVVLCGSNKDFIVKTVDYLISIPSRSTARIQEAHILVLHIICSLVEERF